MRIGLASFLTLLLVAPHAGHATSNAEVGVAAAVNTVTTGIPPVQPQQVLTIGAEIVHNERIITDASGQTQLLFRDGSTFTVGENADVVIDDFIYDPETTKGKLALSITRGAFRFVGGKLSKDGSVAISTPAAVLGVRGGIVTGEVTDAGGTTADLHFGDALMVVGLNGKTQTVTRPGFGVTVPGIGSGPQPPRRTTSKEVIETVSHLVGNANDSGGAASRPTSAAVTAAIGSSSGTGSQLAQDATTSTKTAAAPPPPAPPKGIPTVIPIVHRQQVIAHQQTVGRVIGGVRVN
jgi:hypothetical protein